MLMNYLVGMLSKVDNEEGQGMVEYALIIALIAVALVIALTGLGTAISDKFTEVVNAL